MLKLQAKIFKADEIAVNGQSISVAHLAEAVVIFNGNASANMVIFDEYPGNSPKIQHDRIAGIAQLHMDGQYVVATVEMLDTPMGKIAKQLYESIGIQLAPVTTAVPTSGKLKLQIRQLVIPSVPIFAQEDTPLRQVQNWVEGIEQWPMFALQEHK